MSGDNSSQFYNEPGPCKTYALSLGVPEQDIVLDYAGRRTYDSCYRAQAIFGVEQLIVVTQAFHLPRAIFLCNAFDIDVSGVAADDANYNRRGYVFWWTREIFASTVAVGMCILPNQSPSWVNLNRSFPNIIHNQSNNPKDANSGINIAI
jgi:SanA protein